ncbi:MAG: hypothetical protein H6729_15685 [Deltaproteobacteria bacterium]|nr:hypothetical protein [Deltaproteobacteria bacterium]
MLRQTRDRLQATASRLLAKDRVFVRFQRTLRASLGMRRAIDRNVDRVLAGLNFPSRREVERLNHQLALLDHDLTTLLDRVESLTEAAQGKKPEPMVDTPKSRLHDG